MRFDREKRAAEMLQEHADGQSAGEAKNMTIRPKPHIRRAIRQAAALSGLSDSAFTANAAYQAALEVIDRHRRYTLSEADAEAFFAALDNPAEPTEALREAADRYRSSPSE